MKQRVNDLLNKEIDRKEFLKYMGAGILGLFGVGTIIKSLDKTKRDSPRTGYGLGAYGGASDAPKRRA